MGIFQNFMHLCAPLIPAESHSAENPIIPQRQSHLIHHQSRWNYARWLTRSCQTWVWEKTRAKLMPLIDSAEGPETGMLFEQMITNILITYPTQTALIASALMRVFQEKQAGKHKTAPWSIASERKV